MVGQVMKVCNVIDAIMILMKKPLLKRKLGRLQEFKMRKFRPQVEKEIQAMLRRDVALEKILDKLNKKYNEEFYEEDLYYLFDEPN